MSLKWVSKFLCFLIQNALILFHIKEHHDNRFVFVGQIASIDIFWRVAKALEIYLAASATINWLLGASRSLYILSLNWVFHVNVSLLEPWKGMNGMRLSGWFDQCIHEKLRALLPILLFFLAFLGFPFICLFLCCWFLFILLW